MPKADATRDKHSAKLRFARQHFKGALNLFHHLPVLVCEQQVQQIVTASQFTDHLHQELVWNVLNSSPDF